MESIEQILGRAEGRAAELATEMECQQSHYGSGGYWEAADPEAKDRIRARAAAALAFLERFAVTDSRWTKSAHDVFSTAGSVESGARALGRVISEWARGVRSGQVEPRMVESLSARAVASTDLLKQVRALNADQTVVPAAPIVLAGAALEIALRSAVEESELTITGLPSISSYARALRIADVLSKQDVKEVEQMAGLRNQAAHGVHEALSRERAGLMEQQVNLFPRQLEQAVQQPA